MAAPGRTKPYLRSPAYSRWPDLSGRRSRLFSRSSLISSKIYNISGGELQEKNPGFAESVQKNRGLSRGGEKAEGKVCFLGKRGSWGERRNRSDLRSTDKNSDGETDYFCSKENIMLGFWWENGMKATRRGGCLGVDLWKMTKIWLTKRYYHLKMIETGKGSSCGQASCKGSFSRKEP